MNRLAQDYRAARSQGWRASDALRRARIQAEWREREADEWAPDLGAVRLHLEADDDWSAALDGDFGEREREALAERARRDGVWGLIGQFWNGEAWETADSVWGFIGDDWRGSGYDADVQFETLAASAAFLGDLSPG